MTADLIVYGIIAAALVYWLSTLLGSRNGEERDRPNPFAGENDAALDSKDGDKRPSAVVPFPGGEDRSIRVTKTTLVQRVRIETPQAEAGLKEIVRRDPSFTLDRFMEGAEGAFEMIVTAFAQEDRETLRTLLIPALYNDFDRALTDRATRGETVETRIHAVRGMDLLSALMKGDTAYIAVRFSAQETCLIRNAAGVVIAGDADRPTEMVDIWTFGRDLSGTDPVWYLHETRDEKPEVHKTPIPEASEP